MRFPLNVANRLGAGTMTFQYCVGPDLHDYHVAHNMDTRGYWSTPDWLKDGTNAVRGFYADEGSGTLYWNDVVVASTSYSDYEMKTPDGYNWFGHYVNSCSGVTLAGSTLWIAHTAGTGKYSPILIPTFI